MPRVGFDTLFISNANGTFEPRQKIRVGGVTIGPGIMFEKGVTFGGIDFSRFTEHDFSIETDGDTLVIKAIYTKPQHETTK